VTITTRVRLRGTQGLVVLALLSVSACGSNAIEAGESSSPTSSAAATSDQAYVVFPGNVPAPGWGINSAARRGDPGSRDGLDDLSDMAWNAQYEQRSAGDTEAGFIVVTGFDHNLSADSLMVSAETVPAQGQIAGYSAMWGADPTDPEGWTFVALALSPGHSVYLEGFNVTVDALR
jgi:hypothetical protein